MVQILELVLLCMVGFFLLYLAGITMLAALSRRRDVTRPVHSSRFAVCVPAHNEEGTLETTLRNLLTLDYPKSSFDVFVIADNCTDRTAEVGRNLGAEVLERTDPVRRGKGYALRWCFDQLLRRNPGYDAVVVVDADSTLSRNFLTLMDNYLAGGARVIQSSDMVDPHPDSWSVEVTRIGFTLYNFVRPLGRTVLGCSAGLRGNGMCFSTSVLSSIPWDAYSINEDLEYGLQLLLKGVAVAFAPEARVLATMPRDPRNAQSQRARWERGRYEIVRKYSWSLLSASIRRGSFRLFDAFVDLVTPPIVNLLAGACIMLVISATLWLFGVDGMDLYTILWLLVLGLGIFHMIAGLYVARADRSLYAAILHVPRYALWKLLLYSGFARKGESKSWVRTTREISVMDRKTP